MSNETQVAAELVRAPQEIEARPQRTLPPGSDAGACGQLPLADLCNLKAAIDRVRPVLLFYLSRTPQTQSSPPGRSTIFTVSSLIEDPLYISDRYLTPKHLTQRARVRLIDNGK